MGLGCCRSWGGVRQAPCIQLLPDSLGFALLLPSRVPLRPVCSKEGAWKLVDFENWAWAGQPADVAYALRYTSPEVGVGGWMGSAG
jgi:hypothetical protein